MTTLQDLFLDCEKHNSSKNAIIIPEGPEITYNQFKTEVLKLKNTFLQYLEPGNVVSLVLPNGLAFLVAFLATTWCKAISAPLNPQYTEEEFRFYLEDTQSKIIIVPSIVTQDHPAVLAASKLQIPIWHLSDEKNIQITVSEQSKPHTQTPNDLSPVASDVALFLHTSGTTSKPKGVPLSHLNLTTSINNIINTYSLSPSDCSLIVMPLFHVHGLLGACLSTLMSGGTVVVPSRFSATTFWSLVEKYKVTWYSAVPTIHHILLLRADTDKAPVSVLRFIRSCSSPLAPSQIQKLEERFKTPVLEAYGMTEASHQMSSNPLPNNGPRKPGSVGKGTNVEIAILDIDKNDLLPLGSTGEVCIRGKNVTAGYHNRPDANATSFTPDGWFRTGDQGFLDSDGYLTLTGRIKELINRGGEKISPIEIDSQFLLHEAVAEAVTFAIPDEKYGEEVNAAVVLKPGKEVTEDQLKLFLKTKLSEFKVPKKIFVVNEIPKTATGKVQRRIVREHFLKSDK
eukprot:TRINITY_DN787_c0_g1_i1.p1 TRINITY_DN787_c0_g1~~TRINITY_DN787_c0_g1_i1.p1  ORF type:complete len:511 (-),score=57.46 TRINITY_DN787_c0_g1_i1:32-1564(-)